MGGVWIYMEGVWKVSGRCQLGVLKESGSCLEGVLKVSGRDGSVQGL